MNGRKCILIAEDDPSILKMTRIRLEHEGYSVLSAMDGEEALRQADQNVPIHLFLLDIKLPKLNGYQVCQALKRHPSRAKIPVIVFSASEGQLQYLANRCIEVGATDWLRKPFRTKELLEKIHRALGEQEGPDG